MCDEKWEVEKRGRPKEERKMQRKEEDRKKEFISGRQSKKEARGSSHTYI